MINGYHFKAVFLDYLLLVNNSLLYSHNKTGNHGIICNNIPYNEGIAAGLYGTGLRDPGNRFL